MSCAISARENLILNLFRCKICFCGRFIHNSLAHCGKKTSHKCHVLNEVNTWWMGRRKEEHDFFRIQLEKPSYIKFCLGLCNWQLQNVCVTYIVSIGWRCNQVILYLHNPVDNNILFFAPSECSVYSTAIRCLINLVYYFSDIYMC